MSGPVSRLYSAWEHVVKRSLAHWRLLSSVVLGVVLASAIMAGTVVYFDALRELALKATLAKRPQTQMDILMKGERGPATREEYDRLAAAVTSAVDEHVGWMVRGRILAAKTPTMFLTLPGEEGAAGGDNARSYFASMSDMLDHAELLPGGRPPSDQRLNADGEPLSLEAMIPVEAASLFDVGVGDRLAAVPPWNDDTPWVTVVISGVFQRTDPDDAFWHIEESVLNAATGPSFRLVPFHVSEKAFLEELGPVLRKMDGIYTWHLKVDFGRLSAQNARPALNQLRSMHARLGQTMSGYQQTTYLDDALQEYDRRLFFNKLPMFVVLILIALVVLYYVVTLASLAVDERRGEVALLRSRGASSAQILAVFAMEGATIAVLSILVAPLIAATTISALGFTPAFSDLTGGARLDVSLSGGAYLMSALGGVLGFLALMVPAVEASRIGVTRHRQQAARPTSQPPYQRYYVDVLLLLLSILLFRQLTEQGSVVATNLFGALATNQLLLVLPGLVLLASAMVLLRLFPLMMSVGSRVLSSRLPAGLVMGIWQLARNPTHYARLSLLLILTAGLGIFASSFGATLERSFQERVLYATGSDIRVDGIQPVFEPRQRVPRGPYRRDSSSAARVPTPYPASRPTLEEAFGQVPGVDEASPVLKTSGHVLTKSFGEQYVMFAMDGSTFGDVAFLREDFSDKPVDDVLKSLAVAAPPGGILLPDGSRTIAVMLKPDRKHPSVRLSARVMDGKHRYVTYQMGTLESTGWEVYEASLTANTSQPLQPDPPLTLVSIRIHDTGNYDGSYNTSKLRAGSLLIDEVWVTTKSDEAKTIEGFDDVESWSVLKTTPDAVTDVLRSSRVGYDGNSGSALFSWSQGSTLTTRGIFHGSSAPIPALASRSFVRSTGHSVGEEIEVSVAGYRILVRLDGTMNLFPTMTGGDERFLVADLASLVRYANLGAIDRELQPGAVWLSAMGGADRGTLLQSVADVDTHTSQLIRDRAFRMADSKVDPLVEAGWRALLFVAFGAVLVLSCFGFLVHAYVSFRNRQMQFALLRTVGFSMRQLTAMVWLEQALVIGVGMALGIWMGGRLGATIMPFLGHDDWGRRVLPPFVMQVDWGALIVTYTAMVLVFAIISLGIIWLIQRISLNRVMRLGEM